MTETPEDQVFADAIEVANIPTLLMVLVQLTGELHWLEEPYMPKREQWLYSLLGAQFKLEEMKSGYAYKFLQDEK